MFSRSRLFHEPLVVVALLAACDFPTKIALYGTSSAVNRLIEESVPSHILFVYGCRYGHITLVHRLIANGANLWNVGLGAACEGGHRDIVDLMIANGATWWTMGLTGACEGGRLDLVHLMIANGATRCANFGCNGHQVEPMESHMNV